MRFKERYQKEVIPALKDQFNYSNNFLVPRLQKVVINVGFGGRFKDKDFVAHIEKILTRIAGQKAVLTVAKKSVSAFKIREGNLIGAVVTLRGKRMADFIDKLVGITFPRVRDFRGLDPKAIDRTGNLTIGFKENVAFPEVKAEDIDKIFGLEVCLHSSAQNKEEGLALFTALGFPFKKTKK